MEEIYLDNAATTRVDPDTAAVAAELMCECYGNPSSLHSKGLAAQLRLDAARGQVAAALDCDPGEVLFTSGGTEANNLALLGGAEALRRRGNTVVAMAFEHSSVLSPLKALEDRGFQVRRVNPLPDGSVDPEALLAAVDGDTVLVSCMLVNSEVGTISPLEALVPRLRRRAGTAYLHCDAVQALGKIPFSARRLGMDLLSVSAHKLHAPKGAGALYVRKGVRVLPRHHGGAQERGLRPGTENTPALCAFGYGAEKAVRDLATHAAHAKALGDLFRKKAEKIDGVCINSPPRATPYIYNISVDGYRSETLLHYLAERGIYVSSGSACSGGKPSHVLTAMGLPRQRVDAALRISFSKYNTPAHVEAFFAALDAARRELVRR